MASITSRILRVDAATTRSSHEGVCRRENANVRNGNGRLRAHPHQRVSSAASNSSVRAVAAAAATTALEPPALANPESGSKAKEIGVRRGAIPYKDEAVDCDILVNDGAREAIKAAGVDRFVQFIDPSNPKLVKLLNIMEEGWDRVGVRNKNAGHHSLWPEAFAAGKALLEEAFPEECDPAFGEGTCSFFSSFLFLPRPCALFTSTSSFVVARQPSWLRRLN